MKLKDLFKVNLQTETIIEGYEEDRNKAFNLVKDAEKKIDEAAKLLIKAEKSIKATAKKHNNWEWVGDITNYKDQISNILSSDSGEAGLKNLIKLMK